MRKLLTICFLLALVATAVYCVVTDNVPLVSKEPDTGTPQSMARPASPFDDGCEIVAEHSNCQVMVVTVRYEGGLMPLVSTDNGVTWR